MEKINIELQDYSREGFEPTHYAINGAYKFAFSHLEDLEAHKENWIPMFEHGEKIQTGLISSLEKEAEVEIVSWAVN
jgi:hypothetical protein